MPSLLHPWYKACQRVIWAMRQHGFNGPLIFNKDRVRVIGYGPKEWNADNDE